MSRRPREVGLLIESMTDPVGGNVETQAVERLITDDLLRAFEELTDAQRDVLSLRVVAALSLDETARVIGRSLGATKALQRRALEAMRAKIDLEA
jgi:RNA polymerase sigma-70 factor (ECF subfamily)